MTTQALDNAINEIVTVLRAVDGLQSVPFNPTEQMSYSTFGIVYPFSGTFNIGPIGTRKGLHSIAVDILTKRTDIAKNFQTLRPLIDLVSYAILYQMSDGSRIFNQSIDTFNELTYQWTSSDYGGVPIVGYHFLMTDVKILVNI